MKNDKVNEILEYLKNELKYNNCNIDTKEKGWEQYNGLDDDLLHYIRKIEKENKRLHSIIKEVREYIEIKERNDDNWVDYELLIELIRIKEILGIEVKI